ncbi:hypothetical protein GCM10008965_23620 [Methylorubrum aminovorans]
MARCDPRQDGAGQDRLADHLLARGDGGQRASGRDAEGMHGLADEIFTQYGSEGGTPVTPAGERRRARSFELDVTPPVAADDLTEQNGPTIAELRHELSELVTGIGRRERLGALRDVLPGQHGDTLRTFKPHSVEPEILGKRSIEPYQPRCLDRRWRDPLEEAVRQARVAVVEGEEGGHRRYRRGKDSKQNRGNRADTRKVHARDFTASSGATSLPESPAVEAA